MYFIKKRLLFLSSLLLVSFISFAQQQKSTYILDMVHHNPGEALTESVFNDPKFLKSNGYTGQVMNDFTFAHAAITFDKLSPNIFPVGSASRKWVLDAAEKVRQHIKEAHSAGIKVYYFTDIIVLPKQLVSLYRDEICDENGKISFERPKTLEIHKLMLEELFETFPGLDGLVIRTGETYLNNVPYHTGNNPITNGVKSHVKLLNLLREEVCVKRNKTVFYRTWSFGGMHDSPKYYLDVVNQIAPHANLVFSIKHTKGDYQRTFDFNPTLTLGRHAQIVEVQCQREYEGKGAYPNYVMNGVINGFEEYALNKPQKGFKSLEEIKKSPNFKGIWSWSRGGGWVGPYITNEFWCRLNAYVIDHWALNTSKTEAHVFNDFMLENGIKGQSAKDFRKLCMLSAMAVLRGHASASLPFDNAWVWWMRDEFLAGSDANSEGGSFASEGIIFKMFTVLYKQGLLERSVVEKQEAVQLWSQIVKLSSGIKMTNKQDQAYLKVSSTYGLLLHQIIAEGWSIMALGFEGDQTGIYNKQKLAVSIKNYDLLWQKYREFKTDHPACASLYKPYAFTYIAPDYHQEKGMQQSVDKYRSLIDSQ